MQDYRADKVPKKDYKTDEQILSERVDTHFSFCGCGVFNCSDMMRHILDSLGALRMRIKDDQSYLTPALKTVFKDACHAMLDHILDDIGMHDGSAVRHLMEAFPDPAKKGDGRGWLAIHWAAMIDTTDEDVIREIALLKAGTVNQKTQIGVLAPIPSVKEDEYFGQFGQSKFGESKEESKYNSMYEESSGQIYATTGTNDTASDMGLLPLHLITSLRNPRLANVKQLTGLHPSTLRTPDSRGWLPLHWAARNCSNKDVLNHLIKLHSRSAFHTTAKGQLPFQIALQNKDTSVIDFILDCNPDAVDAIDNKGNTCLHDAARYCNDAGARRVLEINPELCIIKNFKENLPIHRVFTHLPDSQRLRWHQFEVVKLLLETNPETASIRDSHGMLPLHLAVFFHANYEIIEYVYKVYPSATLVADPEGHLPVHYAEDAKTRRLLLESSAPMQSFGMSSSFAKCTL